jgi:2-C-methyl-D-erythritol 2,4-cyclodiphosphate synthase
MNVPFRIGIGYDIHRLVEGRRLILGGVEIPFEKGLLGHSDSDVLTHAICDALLGAAALGDMGMHFPDTDPRFKDVSSLDLLANAFGQIAALGYAVQNVDTVVLAERPRLGPYVKSIREGLAAILAIEPDQISVKAKTSEGMESVGRGEAMAAHAVVLLARK